MITLKELADKVNGKLIGDGTITVSTVDDIKCASSKSIAFAFLPKYKKEIASSNAAAFVVTSDDDLDNNSGILSSNNTDNPDIRELIYKYGVQIAGYKYYLPDEKFLEQEEFFNFFKSGIVPFKRSMPYLNRYFQ